jgi:hypothetical protein
LFFFLFRFLELKEGSPYSDHLDPDIIRNYTFFIFEACSFYHIKVSTLYGDPDVIVYLATSSSITQLLVMESYGPENFVVCPSSLQSKQGTFILRVQGFQSTSAAEGPGSNFTIEWERKGKEKKKENMKGRGKGRGKAFNSKPTSRCTTSCQELQQV